jgi:CarD family transcriptional regulator
MERQYRDRLKRGDVLELAAVVRDLASRVGESRLSGREDDLYGRTRRLLASELRCALGSDAERAHAYIDEHVSHHAATPDRPPHVAG